MRNIAGCALQRRWLVLAFLLLAPGLASAQSAISGVVRDASGAVLPGVTVEATSPVLIEKVRAAVSDSDGRYSIADLRPGAYTITFALTGFNTLRREGVELPTNFTMTINAELPVGSLEESITVTGDAPVVDVTSTQRTHVLSRDMLDAVPTARNYSGLAALMPGVRMSNTDVGGNQQVEQIYMTVHGSRQTDVTVQMDGLQMNSLMSDGQVQAYFSDAANAEMSYQTSGVGADVSGGGVKINMIPKEGGNIFSGQVFVGGSNGSWQSDNVTDELRALGLRQGNRIGLVTDFNFAVGGPIKKDKLWFFTSWRRIATNLVIANNFYKDGSPGIEDQWVKNQMLRLTWQVSPKNKFNIVHDRYPKFKGHEMGALTDPETAAGRRDSDAALYYTGQVKWTSTLSNRLLLEAGYSTNVEYLTIKYQPGIQKDRGTPEWFTQIGKSDLLLGTNYDGRNSPALGIDPKKNVISGTMSYVTGSHTFKTGVQWGFGDYVLEYDVNGDLVQLYRNGVPDSVRVYSTPLRSNEYLNADMGIFAQDSWTIDRLTVNMGVRFEFFNARIKDQTAIAGRFSTARTFSETPNIPDWFDIAPRLGVAYDVFGNAKTALKATFNRYMAGQQLGFPQRYNPLQLQNDTRTWRDLNGDNVAQDNEIGASNNAAFGLPIQTIRPDADIQREYDLEYSAGIQHELVRGLSVTGAFYRRAIYDQRSTANLLFGRSDYTVVNVVSPLDGSIIPAYNLDPTKAALVQRLDSNSTDSELRRKTYNGVELGFAGRLRNAQFFGGWTMDRVVDVHCDDLENNTGRGAGSGAYPANNFPKYDYHFCDQAALDLPFRHEFKLAGSYTLPWWAIQVNAAIQSYAGRQLDTRWSIGRATRYAADCVAPCRPGELVIPNMTLATYVLDLVAPGQGYYARQNQLDLGFRKVFRIGRIQYSGQADIFNATNSSYVKNQNITIGPSLGQPLDILNPRLLRLAVQMRF